MSGIDSHFLGRFAINTSEGAYEGSYTLGKAFTAGNSLTVDYREIDNKDISVSCRLTDIYGNVYWTPAYIY